MAKITVVGGINIDIEGRPNSKLIECDSNIGHVTMAHGGVGRNITENLARLGLDCAMFSLIGNDQMGLGARSELEELGVDVSRVFVREDLSTSVYLSVLDETGDMAVGINDMSIVDEITPELLSENAEFLKGSEVVALDGNLTSELLDFATDMLKDTKLFYDPVSVNKGIRAKDFIGRFFAIKPNIMEAEVILGHPIKTEADIEHAADEFLAKGVKKVFISLNKDGVYFKDETDCGFMRPHKELRIVSATGAGDAFSSVVIMGVANNLPIREIAKLGLAASEIAMEASGAVNKSINLTEVKRRAL